MCTIAKIIWSRQGHEGYFPLPHAKAVGTMLYMMTSDYRGSYTCVSGHHSVVCTLHIVAHAQVAKEGFFPCTPALRVCESYVIRAARGNNTAAVEEKDRRAWTLVICMHSTHALAL